MRRNYTLPKKVLKAFHSSPQSISIHTLEDGCIIEMNDSITKTLGFSREEAMGILLWNWYRITGDRIDSLTLSKKMDMCATWSWI